MKKKTYVAPSVMTVEMEIQGSLLAASGDSTKSTTVENANIRNFEDDWE